MNILNLSEIIRQRYKCREFLDCLENIYLWCALLVLTICLIFLAYIYNPTIIKLAFTGHPYHYIWSNWCINCGFSRSQRSG